MFIFRSDATFLMLSNMTGLRLHPLAPENDEDEDGDDNHDDDSNGEKDAKETNDKDAGPSKVIFLTRFPAHIPTSLSYVCIVNKCNLNVLK